MTKPYQKWREDCVLFLDDCFASDSAVARLSPYFDIRDFRVIFPDARKGKQNGVPDGSVIGVCHKNRWLLLTQDREMAKTHIEEIKLNPDVTILATTRGCSTPEEYEEWLSAIVNARAAILRLYKKRPRPWFATISKSGIATIKTIQDSDATRRTRKK